MLRFGDHAFDVSDLLGLVKEVTKLEIVQLADAFLLQKLFQHLLLFLNEIGIVEIVA